jgi:hypothetical protein
MAIYKQTCQAQQSAWKVTFKVEEHNLFSSGRIGVWHGDAAGKVWQTFTATVKYLQLLPHPFPVKPNPNHQLMRSGAVIAKISCGKIIRITQHQIFAVQKTEAGR